MSTIENINKDISEFKSSNGARIFRLPLEAFPGFWAYSYIVLAGDYQVLIDVGSGFGSSNDFIESGFLQGSDRLGVGFTLRDLTHILITHGHIDHFGGLNFVIPQTSAQIGVHELDKRNLASYEERLIIASRNLESFLIEAGVSEVRTRELMEMYGFHKALAHSIPIDFTYEDIGMNLGPFEFLHVPGHCAGHVVIRCGDVLFSGDHVLADISPHQAPERLTLNTGLSHYLKSLDVMVDWAGEVSVTLGGHKSPIMDLSGRVLEIKEEHRARLAKIQNFLQEPQTINELTFSLFGEVKGYNELLALEEVGAHVEYLYQRNQIEIVNSHELDQMLMPIAIQYRQI
jgi:glyoxylase-like metal-dependent hydrolase (beta-lactamase superfamily II)